MHTLWLTALFITLNPSFGRAWEVKKKLNDGSELRLANRETKDNEVYTLEWRRPDATSLVLWSAPRYYPPNPDGTTLDSLDVSGIAAGIVSEGYLAVLLTAPNDAKLIRGPTAVPNPTFEEIHLPSLAPASVSITQKFQLKDAFTILLDEKRDQGDFVKHVITADKDGKLLYDGGNYEEGAGIVTSRLAPDGSIIVHDPRGKVYPKGDSVLHGPDEARAAHYKATADQATAAAAQKPAPPQAQAPSPVTDSPPRNDQIASHAKPSTPASAPSDAPKPNAPAPNAANDVSSKPSSAGRTGAAIAMLAAAVGLLWLALRSRNRS